MRAFLMKCTRPWIMLSLLLLAAVGCGGGRNDQGVSFVFYGWYTDIGDLNSNGLATGIVPLASLNPEVNPEEAGVTPSSTGGGTWAFAGVQNHLSGEAIRVERAYHTYFIPGASIQPPATSVAAPGSLGPAQGVVGATNEFGDTGSTLPPSYGERGSIGWIGTWIIPPSVKEWIFLNKEYLPEPPFTLVVTTYLTGVTTAGDRLDTNSVDFEVTITPDIVIAPTEGGTAAAGQTAAESDGSSTQG